MRSPLEELEHRRPLWEALADLFLDTVLDEADFRSIARRIVESGYSPEEIQKILWEEVFPACEINARHPAGEHIGFDVDWIQERILQSGFKHSVLSQPRTARHIGRHWGELLEFLPETFKESKTPWLVRLLTWKPDN